MNLVGQIIYSKKGFVTNGGWNKEISFDTTLPDGMYLVRVLTNNQTYLYQVILQK